MYDLGDGPEGGSDRIENLREGSKESMMNMIYNAVISDSDRAVESNVCASEKVKALNDILKFFVGIEEYEKCSNIKKIIDKIQC